MAREYTFQDRLMALRAMLYREDYFEHPYNVSTLSDIKPLVIFIETYLKNRGIRWDRRRETRLEILSYILGFKVETTYDLTPYQAATIYGFLINGDDKKRLGVSADEFLANCENNAQVTPVRRERSTNFDRLHANREGTHMPNM